MPIADPFADKAEPAAAGTEDLTWTEVDVGDGSWTFSNPSGAGVATRSTAGGQTNLGWSIADPVSDNVLDNGSNFNGPRIYKKLTKPDGSDYRLDDTDQNIMVQFWIDGFVRPQDTGDDNPLLLANIGITDDPTATTRTAHFNCGISWGFQGTTANRKILIYTGTSQNGLINGNTRRAAANYQIVGKRGLAVNGLIIKDDGDAQQTSSRNTNKLYGGTGPLYLCIDWGAGVVGSSSAGTLQAKLRYKVINFSDI